MKNDTERPGLSRKLPGWLESRTISSVRASDATIAYYGLRPTKFLSWYDKYGAFRQGALVRVRA
jgi:hypothetical protein